jgi:hypothetical protein
MQALRPHACPGRPAHPPLNEAAGDRLNCVVPFIVALKLIFTADHYGQAVWPQPNRQSCAWRGGATMHVQPYLKEGGGILLCKKYLSHF